MLWQIQSKINKAKNIVTVILLKNYHNEKMLWRKKEIYYELFGCESQANML